MIKDLTAIPLAYGGLLSRYRSPLVTYLTLRRKAQKASTGRPVMQVPWWKSFCWFLSAGLIIGAAWTSDIAVLFADLVSALDEICPILSTLDECRRAALDWLAICLGLGGGTVVTFIIIRTTYARNAARRPQSAPIR